ncbi:MAG: CoA transferase, partial [Desulfovibrio sp.]|nr:CoA transferase [Desulfovibrio sp.]
KSLEMFCVGIGFQYCLTNPVIYTADARDKHKQAIYKRIGEWAATRDKYEVTEHLAKYAVPVGPVLNTKEIMTDESLYDGNTLVKIDQPGYGGKVGTFVTVGVPFTMSNFQPTYGPCPTLGGNNEEVLKSVGFTDADIAKFAANGTTEPLKKA